MNAPAALLTISGIASILLAVFTWLWLRFSRSRVTVRIGWLRSCVAVLLVLPFGALYLAARSPILLLPTRAVPFRTSDFSIAQALPLGNFLFPIWVLGCLALTLRILKRQIDLVRCSRNSSRVAVGRVAELLNRCSHALGCKRPPTLLIGKGEIAATWGVWRPKVYLPNSANAWPTDTAESVLRHEIAHIRNRDWIWGALGDFVCALYWFNPLLWKGLKMLRQDAELMADELVVSSGVSRTAYAKHLLQAARILRPAEALPAQVAFGTGTLSDRVENILKPQGRRGFRWSYVAVLALGCFVIVGAGKGVHYLAPRLVLDRVPPGLVPSRVTEGKLRPAMVPWALTNRR